MAMTLGMLFHKYQRALLETMYEAPYASLSINELARRAGVDPGNTKRYVQRFSQGSLITLTRKGNALLVRPDLSNPETRKIFELFEISRTKNFLIDNQAFGGMLKDIAASLYEKLPEVRMVCLYGPSVQALSISTPIDLAIVVGAGIDTEEITRLASDIIKQFSMPYETKLCVSGTTEMANMWKKGEGCSIDIWNGRIVLVGEGFFWQTVNLHRIPEKPEEENEAVVSNA